MMFDVKDWIDPILISDCRIDVFMIDKGLETQHTYFNCHILEFSFLFPCSEIHCTANHR